MNLNRIIELTLYITNWALTAASLYIAADAAWHHNWWTAGYSLFLSALLIALLIAFPKPLD